MEGWYTSLSNRNKSIRLDQAKGSMDHCLQRQRYTGRSHSDIVQIKHVVKSDPHRPHTSQTLGPDTNLVFRRCDAIFEVYAKFNNNNIYIGYMCIFAI